MTCADCEQRIGVGQLYMPGLRRHVACPSARQVTHDRRVGRGPGAPEFWPPEPEPLLWERENG